MLDFALNKGSAFEQATPGGTGPIRRHVSLELTAYSVLAAYGLLIATTGVATFRIGLDRIDRLYSVSATYVATTVAAMLLLLTINYGATVGYSLGESLTRCLGRSALTTVLPFLFSLLLSFLPLGGSADYLRQPLVLWQIEWAVCSVTGVVAIDLVSFLLVHRWRALGMLKYPVAVVGAGDLAERLVRWLQTGCADSVAILGIFDDRDGQAPGRVHLGSALTGSIDELIELARHETIERIIVALPHSAEDRLMAILRKLKQVPVDICLAPDRAGFAAFGKGHGEFSGLPILNVYRRPLRTGEMLVKSLSDRIVTAVVLVLLSPILLAVAVAVKLDSPGPILFPQDRFGFGHKVIRVYKFRTMRNDLADPGGGHQTERNDPRLTRIGGFLRKTSLDELPQLFNVLRGEMSLVGPRPLPLLMRVQDKLIHEIVSEYAYRHRVKPGITGWAQVNGYRGAINTEEELRARIDHDLYYIDNWSFLLDMMIIIMTLGVFMGHKNAY
jgi:Undecaprenyl-phosphate glucose phosphotransferase